MITAATPKIRETAIMGIQLLLPAVSAMIFGRSMLVYVVRVRNMIKNLSVCNAVRQIPTPLALLVYNFLCAGGYTEIFRLPVPVLRDNIVNDLK
jgi:hypothetical protein